MFLQLLSLKETKRVCEGKSKRKFDCYFHKTIRKFIKLLMKTNNET